jgi:hypothetical protein
MAIVSAHSIVRLGTSFARVMVRRLFDRKPQLPRFVAQYGGDGILAFEPDDRMTLEGAARCYACGRCDIYALTSNAYDALDPNGPMAFVLGVSRHSGHHDCAEIRETATEAYLAELTEVCPVRVPFAPLTALVRRRAIALGSVRREIAHP